MNHIDAMIVDGLNSWRFTGLFGSGEEGNKDKTWTLMRTLKNQGNLSWMCPGDLTEILYAYEKKKKDSWLHYGHASFL